MSAEDALSSQVTQPQGFQEPEFFLSPKDNDYSRELQLSFSYPLQGRIYREWSPLLPEAERAPARRVGEFGERIQRFGDIVSGLSADQLNGDMSDLTRADLVRHGSYAKIIALDTSVSLGIDVGSFIEKKLVEKMQEKYPPDLVYQLISSGMEPLKAMAKLKQMFNNGTPLESLGPISPVSIDEAQYRMARRPAFRDAYQDVTDTWQRKGFGMYLSASERLPNLFGEAQEFLKEFEGMSLSEINALISCFGIVTAEDKPVDSLHAKLMAIGGEAADVAIAVDGYMSAIDDDQEDSANETLDGMITRYRRTGKLVRRGLSPTEAMHLQREVDQRKKAGLRMPFVGTPAIAAVLFGG